MRRTIFTVMVVIGLAGTLLAQLAEQAEAGEHTLPNGSAVHYHIRLLPPASFPELPPGVKQQLVLRHCMIPQTYEARAPENVIHGAFERKGSSDWAVLCSQNGTSALLVFFGDAVEKPMTLRAQPDNEWLGAEYAGAMYGSAWGIAARSADTMHGRQVDAFDHDGIEDAHLERSSVIHYYQDGKWLARASGDQASL
ncbi:hypothetical protein [Paracidobacterium acidisoli]|uniref:Uncharacterized protein n=1 Tax=Paracidobacterium acidisoli TaxID=2303751 RepID=A0A372IPK8_9BACT|nr:hypothetical protein [Paracidobacterium acidisoli]MBT9330984.1 hypothetical protein [Paracidobacterium acidisoli]